MNKTFSIHLSLAIYLAIVLFTMGCAPSETFDLFDSKRKVISVPSQDKAIIQSAEILKSYLDNIGKSIWQIDQKGDAQKSSIQLIVDQTLDENDIRYGVENDRINITSGSAEGLQNAVYTFLEDELGVQFLTPDYTLIPDQNDIQLSKKLQFNYTPPVHTRTVHSRLFYQDSTFAAARKVTREAFPYYAPNARVHTFNKLLPAEIFYDRHPEYYALRNGKRRTTQLCLTNKDVLKIVKDSVASWKVKHSTAKVVSVSQDDNTQYCQCAECEKIHQKEESPAGSIIYFVNEVAKEFPDIQISTLAYQYTRKAPKYIIPEKNVLITLCSIECDRSAPIAKKCVDFTNDLKEWGKISDNIRIWDYTTQFTNFLAPFPNLHTLQPNVQLFVENNAKWIFEQHSNQPSELFELRSYLTSKLLWNPNLDFEKEKTKFLDGYYKTAGPYIGEYITRVHDAIQQDSNYFLFLYGDPSQAFESFLNKDSLISYDQLFDRAAEVVNTESELSKRVDRVRLSIDYAILEMAKRDLRNNLNDEFFNIKNRINRFKNTCEEGEITAMNEMRYTVEEYLTLYENSLNRMTGNNLAATKKVTLNTKPKKYAAEDPQSLTDGAIGGASFYANWLGFEGNDMEADIDLGSEVKVQNVRTAFLQVTNHIVFFPTEVEVYGAGENQQYTLLATQKNDDPLTSKSKINDIKYWNFQVSAQKVRYIKIVANNMSQAPDWHNAAGLPAWIFCDEVMVD